MKYLENDIAKAIGAHGVWKVRLHFAIENGRVEYEIADVGKDDLCAFGRWLYGASITEAGRSSPDYILVRKLHAEFHACAAQVLELVADGKTDYAKKLMAENGLYAQISSQLIEAMVNWKHSVGDENKVVASCSHGHERPDSHRHDVLKY